MTPLLIYCAGKNARFERAALDAGYRLGVQLPNALYHPPAFFADQDWRKPNRETYMRALSEHRPEMATVLDLERHDQLGEVLAWAEEAAQHARRVVIIPKAHGVIRRLPRRVGAADVVLGYSVPTRHGGTAVWPDEFRGWPIHLLGGSPHAQMRLWSRLRGIAEVVSADGNMSNKMSHAGRFWCAEKGPKGHWRNLREIGVDLEHDNNLEAFQRSCVNIVAAWTELHQGD